MGNNLTLALSRNQFLNSIYDVNSDDGTREVAHFTWEEVNDYLLSAGNLQMRSAQLKTLISLRSERASDGIRLFDTQASTYLDKVKCVEDGGCNMTQPIYYYVSDWASDQILKNGWFITPPDRNGEVKLAGPAKFGDAGKYQFFSLAALTIFGCDFPPTSGIKSDNFIGVQDVNQQGDVAIYFIDLKENQVYDFDGKRLIDLGVVAQESPPASTWIPTDSSTTSGVSGTSKTKAATNGASEAGSPHTVVAALGATEEFLGKNRVWKSSKPEAQAFLRNYSALKSEIQGVDFVQTEAGLGKPGVAEVNGFLKRKGFDIELKADGVGPGDVSAAAVMDIQITWTKKGEVQNGKLSVGSKKEVPGVWMPSIGTAYVSAGHDHPIIQVPTQNGFDVYMTRYDGAVGSDPMALSTTVSGLMDGISSQKTIRGTWFPMVDFEKRGDLSWLLGAMTTDVRDGNPVKITQALAQYRLRMNEVGARAEAAVAIGTSKGLGGPGPVYIDGPFLVWFVKDGVTYFSAYIDEDSMKRPEGLD